VLTRARPAARAPSRQRWSHLALESHLALAALRPLQHALRPASGTVGSNSVAFSGWPTQPAWGRAQYEAKDAEHYSSAEPADIAPEQLLRDVPLERVQQCPPVLLHAWEGLGRDVATCRPANRHGALCAVCSHRSASAKKGRSVPRESSEKPIGRGNVRWSTRVAYEGCYRNEGRWENARGRHSSLVRGTAGYCGVLRGTEGYCGGTAGVLRGTARTTAGWSRISASRSSGPARAACHKQKTL
jgi:hypothetical protein